jgi:HD-like signal output (HDOD) protein
MTTPLQMLKKFSTAKTLPHVAIRLSKLISNENSNMKEFEKIIKMDPTLVLRLLRMVNSSYYGLQQKIDSISRAVIFIGMRNLRNMVVMEAIKEIFKKSSHEDFFSRSQLWLHCAAVSICSQMITERIFGKKGEDAFLCGILHDIGMIVEDQVVQDLFIETCKSYKPNGKPIIEYEREIIGTDHCEVGFYLARDWKLPVGVQEGIRYHHNGFKKMPPSSIAGTIQIAEYLVSKLNYSAIPGMEAGIAPDLSDHIRDNAVEYRALVKDFPDEMLKAKELYEPQED